MQTWLKAALVAGAAAGLVIALLLGVMPPANETASKTAATNAPRTADGKPDLNGIWQALNTANWDLEDHAARLGPVVALGAAFSIPGGNGVVEGDAIPYLPQAAAKEERERRDVADLGPGNQMLSAGRAARHLHAVSLSDRSDATVHPDRLRVRRRSVEQFPSNSTQKSPTTPGWDGRSATGKAIRS